jgi:hypothetical protein
MFVIFIFCNRSVSMLNSVFSGVVRNHHIKSNFRASALLLLAGCALAFSGAQRAEAQADKATAMPTTPSAGKALICIFRVYRFTGSASHDNLFVNGVFLARLLNDEYACTEAAPGTVVVSGLPKMYYGSVIQSAGAALNDARKKENERARFEAEAGKTYYMKWTAGAMATGIKVTPVDEVTGSREMSKLHPSKPPEDKDNEKQETK